MTIGPTRSIVTPPLPPTNRSAVFAVLPRYALRSKSHFQMKSSLDVASLSFQHLDSATSSIFTSPYGRQSIQYQPHQHRPLSSPSVVYTKLIASSGSQASVQSPDSNKPHLYQEAASWNTIRRLSYIAAKMMEAGPKDFEYSSSSY
jgi:hypothetical protein